MVTKLTKWWSWNDVSMKVDKDIVGGDEVESASQDLWMLQNLKLGPLDIAEEVWEQAGISQYRAIEKDKIERHWPRNAVL